MTTVLANGTLQIQRLEGSEFINSYNKVILLQLRSNNDIQWLYCGKDVNTVCAYICDYVPKEELRNIQVLPIIYQVLSKKTTWQVDEKLDRTKELKR